LWGTKGGRVSTLISYKKEKEKALTLWEILLFENLLFHWGGRGRGLFNFHGRAWGQERKKREKNPLWVTEKKKKREPYRVSAS